MTEASPGVLMATREGATAHPVSVGVPHFFTDVAMVRDGEVVPVDAGPAELLVRGPDVFAGYRGRPEDTLDGWFRTGDVLTVAPDGWATVVDRVRDMSISGGENVYPAEVEAVLLAVDGVVGETGVGFVQPGEGVDLDPDALREHLTAHLARYKVPRRIVITGELPRNATGKPRRTELRATAEGLT
ncbi:AMP-binding protein [Pseudonocardia sp. KRD-169]|uniref:AMP-binding protein n=2 Tax=Pseudonocardia abyssalis TaxID=2792008 RepID=A0ABS6UUX0_9PSEU|nr:AMP-binding protein [Pseudonocardia abyssalis]MBW0136057.1 AMP-binding protein [Pseudonocardia abyssalis]